MTLQSKIDSLAVKFAVQVADPPFFILASVRVAVAV